MWLSSNEVPWSRPMEEVGVAVHVESSVILLPSNDFPIPASGGVNVVSSGSESGL